MKPWERDLKVEGEQSSSPKPWERELQVAEEPKPSLVDTWEANKLPSLPSREAPQTNEPMLDMIGDRNKVVESNSTQPNTEASSFGSGLLDNFTFGTLGAVSDVAKHFKEKEDEALYNVNKNYAETKAAVQHAHGRWSHIVNNVAAFWDEESATKAQNDSNMIKSYILDELKAKNINAELVDGKIYANLPDGRKAELNDPKIAREILSDLAKNENTIGMSVVGATYGFNAVKGSLPAKMIGASAGAGLGAYLGAGFDAVLNNIDLAYKIDAATIHSKMVDEGVAAAILEPLGIPLAKATAASMHGIKRAWDFVLGGNRDGAMTELKKVFNVSDAQIHEAIKNLEAMEVQLNIAPEGSVIYKEVNGELVPAITQTPKVGTQEYSDRAIKAIALTKPGGEKLVAAANVFDPSTSSVVGNQVFKRAEEVLKATEELAANNNYQIVKQALDKYTDEVKTYYGKVKDAPAEFTVDYSFNFEKLGIEPILDTIGAKIENPVIKQRFVDTLTRIEQASEGRTFTDLIDLRQAVNEIKNKTSKIKYSDREALDNVLKSIDDEISTAADTYIPNAKVWKENWVKAKTEYAKMKELEKNVLFKSLSRKGISETDTINIFKKYIQAEDNTFVEVLDVLPKNVRNRLEGSVLNILTEHYSAGQLGGNRAINFPMLSEAIKKVSLEAPKVKQTARLIHRMAEVFKNDVNLAAVSGRIEIPSFQSYLTTDPGVRLQYEIASSVFNYAKMLIPGDQANTLAMVRATGRVLENPLDAKAFNELTRAMPKDKRNIRQPLSFDEDLNQLRSLYAERQMALKQLFGKDAPPRLAWKASPERLAALQNPEARILSSADEVLYGTQRGLVGRDPSEVTFTERADDLITEFIWRGANVDNDTIVADAIKYMDDNRYESMMKRVAAKLKADEAAENAKVIANSIRSEAGILISRIERDYGLKLPKEEAEKIVAMKFKEIMEKCNGR